MAVSYIPLTGENLSQEIRDMIPGFSAGPTPDFTKFCAAVVDFLTRNTNSNTKDRLDQLETDYNNLITALTALASALSAIPITAAAGAALATAMAAQAVTEVTRAAAKTTQDTLLPKPYLDGVKS